MKKICVTIALVITLLFFGIQVKAQTEPLEPDSRIQNMCQELEQKLCENKSKFVLTKRLLSGSETRLIFEDQQFTVYIEINSYFSKESAEEEMELYQRAVSNRGVTNRLDAFGDIAFASFRWIGFVHNAVRVFVTVIPKPKLDLKQEPVQETTSDQSVPKESTDTGILKTSDPRLAFVDGPGKTPLRSTHPVAQEFATYLWEAVINLQK